jgi:F-type H+-transporting ATPase subunit delta
MSDSRLSGRYAKSLIDLAQEQNQLDAITKDIRLFNEVVKSSRDFVLMLRNPIIQADKKIKIVEQIFKDQFNPITFSFITLVIRKGREAYLPEFAASFLEQYNKLKHIVKVKITTAVPLNEELANRLTALVKKKTGLQNIELDSKINPDIIGGYILQFEDKLYDASVSRNLEVLDDNFRSNIYVKQL